jgi:predicted RNase H-like nuclease
MATIGGADGCPGGWICVERDTITGELFGDVLATTRDLLEHGRHLVVLTLDIPIGLSDSDPRACDLEARQLLTAERIVYGTATTVPSIPPEDRFGLRMEMVT